MAEVLTEQRMVNGNRARAQRRYPEEELTNAKKIGIALGDLAEAGVKYRFGQELMAQEGSKKPNLIMILARSKMREAGQRLRELRSSQT